MASTPSVDPEEYKISDEGDEVLEWEPVPQERNEDYDDDTNGIFLPTNSDNEPNQDARAAPVGIWMGMFMWFVATCGSSGLWLAERPRCK